MPDKWEYPAFFAWDLAFHMIPFARIDPEFAKQPAAAVPARVVHAPQRPAPGLRVRPVERQPAGPRLGLLAGLQDQRRRRAPRHRLPGAGLPEAAAELHLVGQPQGPERAEHLRRRLPRAGQHRRLRPLPAAADRRPPGAGGRHRLDGRSTAPPCWRWPLELAQHNRAYEDIASKFFEHFVADRRRAEQPGRDGPVARGGRLLLRPAQGRRAVGAAAGALPGRAGSRCWPWRSWRKRSSTRTCRQFEKRMHWFLENRKDLVRAHLLAWKRKGEVRAAPDAAGPRRPPAPGARPALPARRAGVPVALRRAVAVARATGTSRTCSGRTARSTAVGVRARRIGHRACSAATPTGAGRSGSRSTTC